MLLFSLVERQKAIPISYKGIRLDAGYLLDMVVEDQGIVEIKAVSELLPVLFSSLLTDLTGSVVVIYATTPMNSIYRLDTHP